MKLLISHIADLDGISPIILMNLLGIDFEYEFFLNDTDTDHYIGFLNRPKVAAFLKDKND